ncbi:hypothetical protein BZL54_31530, partial [Burkholderia ubonensis subsp. mesacidophila]
MTARVTSGAPQAGRVTVIGSLNMDLVVRAPRLPLPGETLAGHAFAQSDNHVVQQSQARSTVGSVQGNVSIKAGENVH